LENQAQKYCCICNTHIDSFIPAESFKKSEFIKQFELIGSDIQNFFCSSCRCFDRERHLMLYFHALDLFEQCRDKSILHIAPERNILKKLLQFTNKIIVGDFYPEQYEKEYNVMKMDVTEINLPDKSIDMVIANHVLEHIPDYPKALAEIFRVVKDDGCAILQTPFTEKIYGNFEDKMIDKDELRQEWYGRYDHVRIFGLRLFDDIKAAGFKLHLLKHVDVLGFIDSKEYGVNQKEPFIFAEKCLVSN
jgi:SAM-dependent methyltransferase